MTKGQTSSRLKYGKQSIQAIIIQPLVRLSVVTLPGMVFPMITHTQKGLGFHELIKLWCMCL